MLLSPHKNERRILVITSWSLQEGLIQSSTLPYLYIIRQLYPNVQLYLLTEEKQNWNIDQKEDTLANLKAKQITWLPHSYYHFGVKKIMAAFLNFFMLWWLVVSKRITHIHCFCTPAGAIGYGLSMLTGKKLIIDSYEPHAESMVENGTWSRKSIVFRLLWWLEKKQSARAFYCLAAASGMNQYAKEKYQVALTHYSVRPTCVDLHRFQYNQQCAEAIRAELGWENKIVCVYAGKLGGIYLEAEVFDFFKVAYQHWGERFRVLLLSPATKQEILDYCAVVMLPTYLIHVRKVAYEQVPAFLSVGDFAITPVKPVPSKRFCSPIKDGEYWAIGLPVVIPANISDDSSLIEKYKAGAVLPSLNAEEYKKAVEIIEQLFQENKQELRMRIRMIAENYRNYNIAFEEYNKIYGANTL